MTVITSNNHNAHPNPFLIVTSLTLHLLIVTVTLYIYYSERKSVVVTMYMCGPISEPVSGFDFSLFLLLFTTFLAGTVFYLLNLLAGDLTNRLVHYCCHCGGLLIFYGQTWASLVTLLLGLIILIIKTRKKPSSSEQARGDAAVRSDCPTEDNTDDDRINKKKDTAKKETLNREDALEEKIKGLEEKKALLIKEKKDFESQKKSPYLELIQSKKIHDQLVTVL